MTPLHEAARQYAEAGWPIFPIEPNGKRPLPGSNGFYDATTDLTIIDAWWQANPNANIGFEPERAGLCVIDVDDMAQVTTGDHPRRAITPRGGCHDYYAGSLPGTQSKIAPHVDTRGRSSYVLVPPSIVNGKPYRWQCDWPFHDFSAPDIPEWIVEKCKPTVKEARKADDYEEDKPEAIRLANLYLNLCVPMDSDDPSQDDYAVACRLLDFGLSIDTAVRLAMEHGASEEWARLKLENASNYRQNEEGCDVPTSTKEAFAAFSARLLSEPHSLDGNGSLRQNQQTALDRFGWHSPIEYRDRPPLTFYDEDRMLPHEARGTVGVMYGASGHHKTNTLLTMMVQTALDHDVLVLYVAGEGVDGFGRDRVWAHAKARGLDDEWVDRHIQIVERMPVLSDYQDTREFLDTAKPFIEQYGTPAIVVLDTLGAGTPGIDENSKLMGDILGGNGACGMIKNEWGCTVIAVAHVGKDEKRGIRGHSSQYANADFILSIDNSDASPRAIKVRVEKMRDGDRKGREAYYSIELQGVPVPVRINEGQYRDLAKAHPEDQQGAVERRVRTVLRDEEAYGWERGLSEEALLDAWAIYELDECPGETGDPGVREWMDKKGKMKDQLRGGKGKKWAAELYEERLPDGVDYKAKREGRWRLNAS